MKSLHRLRVKLYYDRQVGNCQQFNAEDLFGPIAVHCTAHSVSPKSIKNCQVCNKSYSSKFLAQCLKCSQDGTVFVCDECRVDHDHHNEETSLLQHDESLSNDEIVATFSRVTNINLKQAKELWAINGMKLVDSNSRVSKLIVEYFNNSNVTDKKCQVENIWSVKRKSVDKRFSKIEYDTSKTMLLWSDQLYHQDLPTLMANGFQIIVGHTPTYRYPGSLCFFDRIQDKCFIPSGKHQQNGVLILCEVCTDKMHIRGAYREDTFNWDNWRNGIYKTVGRNIPDPSVTELIGSSKVQVGKTVPSLKLKDKQCQEYNSYSVWKESRVKLKYIVHYKEI